MGVYKYVQVGYLGFFLCAQWHLCCSLINSTVCKQGMISRTHNIKSAFTLVEIMIVLALIGLLATLMVPRFVKARKQSQGRRILSDVRLLDACIDRWAFETGKKDGDSVDTNAASVYMKTGWHATDLLGNLYVVSKVGSNQIAISPETKDSLANVNIDWGAY